MMDISTKLVGDCISAPTPLAEVELLVSVLKENFDLVGKIQKRSGKEQSRIYLGVSQMKTLRTLVLPYLHPSIQHKLGL